MNELPLLSGFFAGMVVVATITFSTAANVYAGKVNHPASDDCYSCHTSQSHPMINQRIAGECIACHANNGDGGMMTVRRKSGMQEDSTESSQAQLAAGDDKAGLSVQMYYDETRIGAEPNKMVMIPAGKFIMGTDERLPDEGPQHTVNLDAFYIDKYEVTNLQYKKFIDATGHKSPRNFTNRTYPQGKVDHPVTYVNWYDAVDYCTWAGKRLPTDEEWEKAARGTDGRSYPWGNTFDIRKANMPQRWISLKQDGDTTPVGAFKEGVSVYGLYDMSGNVWEWTSSWYKPYPGNKHITENYGEKYKTLKGGSWWDCSFYKCGLSAPTYNRSFFMRTTKNKSFGFRCAKDADGQSPDDSHGTEKNDASISKHI